MGAIPTLKGLCTYFAFEEIRKRVQKYDFLLIFSIPVAATADLMVSRIGNSNSVIGPNCDTIKLTSRLQGSNYSEQFCVPTFYFPHVRLPNV